MITSGFTPGRSPPPRIGRYELTGELGFGGMGRVFSAIDPKTSRRVALKVVRDDLGNETMIRHATLRLLREAWVLAKVRHPNVVRFIEVSDQPGAIFLATELVEGMDLDAWCLEPRDWRQVVDILVGTGRGLAAVHGYGLVHGDFKPSNILVGEDGLGRLADFGLAVPAGIMGEPTGMVIGTPKYMAPERRRGAAPSVLADQFSFCATLFETLGAFRELPFKDRGPPQRFWDIVRRGRAERPEDRYLSMHEILDFIDHAVKDAPTRALPPQAKTDHEDTGPTRPLRAATPTEG